MFFLEIITFDYNCYFKYFRKVSEDNIALHFDKSILTAEEKNQARKQLQLLEALQSKTKRNNYRRYDEF